jgi:hypothetical protein
MLVVLERGEGVRGMRPPAVLVEKMLWWLLSGVDTAGDAILLCVFDCSSRVDRAGRASECRRVSTWSIEPLVVGGEVPVFEDLPRVSTKWILEMLVGWLVLVVLMSMSKIGDGGLIEAFCWQRNRDNRWVDLEAKKQQ